MLGGIRAAVATPPRLDAVATPPLSRAMDGVRLHVVTGKGGIGKTTVAAALALALAAPGQAGPARRGRGPAGHQPDLRRAAARHRRGPPRHARGRRRGVGAVGRRQGRPARVPPDVLQARPRRRALERMGAIDFATTIAPGVRDVLLTGKVYEAVGRTTGTRRGTRAPRTTTPSSSTPRRPAGSPASSTSTRGRRPRQGRPDPLPGRVDHPDAARPRRPSCTS